LDRSPLTVAMLAAMPYPMAKASVIRVSNIVHSLVSVYDDVLVEVFAYRGTESEPSHPRIVLHLVGGFDPTKAQYYTWRNKLAADLGLVRALLTRGRKVDVIHCHTIEGLCIAVLFKLVAFSRAPICLDVHGPIIPEMVHYGLIPNWRPVIAGMRLFERLLLRFVSHVFVSNEGLGSQLSVRVGAERVSVVFDYVDLAKFGADRADRSKVADLRARYKSGGERLITYLGMFKDYQGVEYLIRAFAELAPSRPELRLLLVGDGPRRAEYDAVARGAGVADRVIMPGLVPHAEVANFLEISDVVVSPRVDNEITKAGFVSQMPEYMAAGKLIVSTPVSGCQHLLRNGAGILVAPNDVEALRAGLEKALRLSEAEIAGYVDRARRNVAQFTWQQGIRDVRRTYRALLAPAEGHA
jgi:glycosyltransferase involved in cell wall biosynthesis